MSYYNCFLLLNYLSHKKNYIQGLVYFFSFISEDYREIQKPTDLAKLTADINYISSFLINFSNTFLRFKTV